MGVLVKRVVVVVEEEEELLVEVELKFQITFLEIKKRSENCKFTVCKHFKFKNKFSNLEDEVVELKTVVEAPVDVLLEVELNTLVCF